MAQTTASTARIQSAATQENVLPRRQVALLGTFMKPNGAEALILDSRGRLHTVTRGDRIGRAIIVAIETGALHLAEDGRALVLHMPGVG